MLAASDVVPSALHLLGRFKEKLRMAPRNRVLRLAASRLAPAWRRPRVASTGPFKTNRHSFPPSPSSSSHSPLRYQVHPMIQRHTQCRASYLFNKIPRSAAFAQFRCPLSNQKGARRREKDEAENIEIPLQDWR